MASQAELSTQVQQLFQAHSDAHKALKYTQNELMMPDLWDILDLFKKGRSFEEYLPALQQGHAALKLPMLFREMVAIGNDFYIALAELNEKEGEKMFPTDIRTNSLGSLKCLNAGLGRIGERKKNNPRLSQLHLVVQLQLMIMMLASSSDAFVPIEDAALELSEEAVPVVDQLIHKLIHKLPKEEPFGLRELDTLLFSTVTGSSQLLQLLSLHQTSSWYETIRDEVGMKTNRMQMQVCKFMISFLAIFDPRCNDIYMDTLEEVDKSLQDYEDTKKDDASDEEMN